MINSLPRCESARYVVLHNCLANTRKSKIELLR